MLENLKKEVYKANLSLPRLGLIELTWGNVSGIDESGRYIVIKPSGVPYDEMSVGDMVVVDIDGKVVEGKLNPSSDLPTHIELYKVFKGVRGVVHTHSKFATSFAQARRPIPALGTTHADCFYGDIPITRSLTADEINGDYEKNMGRVIAERFNGIDHNAVPAALVAAHGLFAWGDSPQKAVENAFIAEKSAEIAFMTVLLGGNERIEDSLLDKHYYRKHGKDSYYGQKK